MRVETETLPLAAPAPGSFFAGFIDSVVGGLVQLPVLFSVFPQELPAALFGADLA